MDNAAVWTTAVYQPRSAKQKSYLAQLYITSAVCQPRSAELRHIWCKCVSPARYSCMSTASKTKAKALLDDTAMSTRAVSTAIRKAKTYLAQLYINRDQHSENISELYTNSNKKRKPKHFWVIQPCRPVRYMNGEQQSKSISGAAIYHQRGIAVYQQP